MMQANVGTIDRAIRIGGGLALILFAVLADHPLRAWGWIGLLPLATGLVGWCPAYVPFAFTTCRTR